MGVTIIGRRRRLGRDDSWTSSSAMVMLRGEGGLWWRCV
jgi:hypothetical protein